MRIHSKLRSALILTLALATTPQIALPVFAQGATPSIKPDSGSYGPIVTIVSPEYSDIIQGETQIVVGVTPRNYPAQSIELLVDGRSVSGVLPVQTKFAWKTGLFIDGPHILSVRVTDTQGFIGQSETTVYINNGRVVDEKAPILRWLGVKSGDTLSGATRIRLEAADNFGVKHVIFSLNTAIAPEVRPPLASWITTQPPYEFKLDTEKYEDGLYIIDAYAYDAKDNERIAPRLTFRFRNQSPTPLEVPSGGDEQIVDPLAGRGPLKPTYGGFKAMPPLTSPTISIDPSAERNGALSNRSSTTESIFNRINPLRAPKNVSAPKISDPPFDLRVVNTVVKPPANRVEPTVQPDKVPVPLVVKTPDKVAAMPPPPVNGSPKITRVEKNVRYSVESVASTPVTLQPLEREFGKRVVFATSPDVKPRVAFTAPASNDVSSGDVAPGTTVSDGKTGSPETVVSFAPFGQTVDAAPNRLVRNTDNLLTAPDSQVRVEVTQPLSINTRASGFPSVLSTPSQGIGSPVAEPRGGRPGFQVTAPGVGRRVAAGENVTGAANSNQFPTVVTRATITETDPATGQGSSSFAVERNTANARVTKPEAYARLPKELGGNRLSSERGRPSITTGSQNPTTRISETNFAPSRFAAPLRKVSNPNLPTLPRLALTPNLNRAVTQPANAGIVIAPSPDAPKVYVATKNDTLAAIAARRKLPVSAVAAANNLKQNARVAKGTRVLLPQELLVSYQGQAVTGDVAPYLIGTTSVAPFRFLFEKQGGQMNWDAKAQRVTAQSGNYEVTIEVGSDKAIVNKEEVLMDMAAFLLSGRTMVPVRFFEKAFHAKVEWEPSTGRIFVAMTP